MASEALPKNDIYHTIDSGGLMKTKMNRRLWLVTIVVSSLTGPAHAEDIFWVGYQFGPPGGLSNLQDSASFFHGDQWLNYWYPGEEPGQDGDPLNDVAIFDEGFDPQENGMPHHVYFGDFTVPVVPIYNPNSFVVPGGDAQFQRLEIRNGTFTFHFTDQLGMSQGSLAVLEDIRIGNHEFSSSLVFRGGQALANYVAISSGLATANLTLQDAELVTSRPGLFDIGVGGGRGSMLVTGNSLFQAGYTRVGENGGSNGLLEIVGSQAEAQVNGMQIGATGTGRMELRQGATLASTDTVFVANFGDTADGIIRLSDSGTSMHVSQNLIVGDSGTGVLQVDDSASAVVDWDVYIGNTGSGSLTAQTAGQVQARSGYIAIQMSSSGDAEVSGSGSRWSLEEDLFVGQLGEAELTASDFGTARVGRRLHVGNLGTVDVHEAGIVNVGVGDAPAAGSLRVGPGGILTGGGSIVGDVLIDGGSVSPGASPGALHITGNYHQLPGSVLSLEIGGTTPRLEYDQLIATGNMLIEGAVHVSFLDGFVARPGDRLELLSAASLILTGPVIFNNARPGLEFTTALDNGVYSLTVTAVPEPSAVLVFLLGSSILVLNARVALTSRNRYVTT